MSTCNAPPLIITVVRNYAMYDDCIARNPHCDRCEKLPIDNSKAGEFITVLYNRRLNQLDYANQRWLIFCHEDFKPTEDLDALLDKCDPDCLYGPIGGILERRNPWRLGGEWIAIPRGLVTESNKDGTEEHEAGCRVPFGTEVEAFDCQCLIVHSSLIGRCDLRFDENLSFDFYVEDFCLAARLLHGIRSLILPMNCHHYSKGNVQPRFFVQKEYLDRKYPTAEAWGSCGYNIGGGRTAMRRMQKRIRRFLDAHARPVVNWYFRLIRPSSP